MLENELHNRPERHPVISIIILLIASAIGFVGGGLIVFYCYLPFYSGTEEELMSAIQNVGNNPELKMLAYMIQAGSTLIGLLVVPAYLLAVQRKSLWMLFFKDKKTGLIPIAVTSLIVIVFMALNSIFIEWNSNLHFPDWLRWFEEWAREKEILAKHQTEMLTKFNSLIELIVALIVIGILPAIGEEIVFRGLIQNEIYRGTKNIHLSIWIAAILFSAIHLQFFGFLPRLLLGALFGYLYYWSGNLSLAILAHFINNGVSVVAIYLYQQDAFEYDLESSESAPTGIVIFSAALTAGLLYYFYKYFEHGKPSINSL